MNQREFEVAFAEACHYAINKYNPMTIHPVLIVARDQLSKSFTINTREQMIEEIDSIFQKLRDEYHTMRRVVSQ